MRQIEQHERQRNKEINGDLSALKIELTELGRHRLCSHWGQVKQYCYNQYRSSAGLQVSTALQINASRLKHHVHFTLWFHSEHAIEDASKHKKKKRSSFREVRYSWKRLTWQAYALDWLKFRMHASLTMNTFFNANSRGCHAFSNPSPLNPLLKAVPCETLSIINMPWPWEMSE